MTTLIIAPAQITPDQLDRVLDDFYEAVDVENETGFVTRVALTGWHKNGLPRYERLNGQTWIEGFIQCQEEENQPVSVELAIPAEGVRQTGVTA